MTKPGKAAGGGSPIPTRDDVVRDVVRVRESAQEGRGWRDHQLRRLRQALRNRRGRFALLFAVANDPVEQREITKEIFAQMPNEAPVELPLDEAEESILAALMGAPGAPAPLVVYGIEKLLPSSEKRHERRKKTLDELQYRRELFRGLDRPVVLWMPDYAFAMIGQKAADFWSWQSGTFFFTAQPVSRKAPRRASPPRISGDQPTLFDILADAPELGATVRALSRGENVALTGTGGRGKTTLALAAADRVRELFPDGVHFVEFPRQRDGGVEVVLRQIIEAATGPADLPSGLGALRAVYDDVLNSRRALIVVDDVPDADTARLLVPPRPSQVLFTSRERGEMPDLREIVVGALTPEASVTVLMKQLPDLKRSEAKTIAALAGGSPLVLKLLAGLAARDGSRALVDLAKARQNDPHPGFALEPGSGLIATVIERLSPAAVSALRALSVFTSDFDRAAAEAMCQCPIHDALAELERAGLIEAAQPDRLRLHPSIRELVEPRLLPDERMAAQARHSNHFLRVLLAMEEAYRSGAGHSGDPGTMQLRSDWSNIRQGQVYAASQATTQQGAALLAAIYALGGRDILAARLSAAERLTWFQGALVGAEKLGRNDFLAPIFQELGEIHRALGMTEEAGEYDRRATESYARAVETAHANQDFPGLIQAYSALARLKVQAGELNEALESYENVVRVAREADMPALEANACMQLGNIHRERGDLQSAEASYRHALEVQSETGDPSMATFSSLGNVAQLRQDWAAAREWYERALQAAQRVGDIRGTANTLVDVGLMASQRNELDDADQLLGRALAMLEQLGDTPGQIRAQFILSEIALRQGDLDTAEKRAARALEAAERAGLPSASAEVRRLLAQVSESRGDFEGALEHYHAALDLVDQDRQAATLLFDLARLFSTMERIDESVAANLESLSRRSKLGVDRGLPNRRLLARQRRMVGTGKFKGLLRRHLDAESADALDAVIASTGDEP